MDFLIHYRIHQLPTANLFRASLQQVSVVLCAYEGTMLVSCPPNSKKGVIAYLQETLRSADWEAGDFMYLYFSVQDSTLNCWRMKRPGRLRLTKMGEDHPFFGV